MIAIVNYELGNISNICNALKMLGKEDFLISDNIDDLYKAEALILPGVGSFGDGIQALLDKGIFYKLRDIILSGKPTLGICLGMQLLMEKSKESPGIEGLGIIKGEVKKIPNIDGIKIPHTGWNNVKQKKHSSVFDKINNNEYFYFVHSFYISPIDRHIIIGETNYGIIFPSIIVKDRLLACQFHPEKSQYAGLQLINNFLRNICK